MHYLENVTNDSRDKRILNMFMGIVSDLNLFRRELRKISKNFVDNLLDTIFAKWKKLKFLGIGSRRILCVRVWIFRIPFPKSPQD